MSETKKKSKGKTILVVVVAVVLVLFLIAIFGGGDDADDVSSNGSVVEETEPAETEVVEDTEDELAASDTEEATGYSGSSESGSEYYIGDTTRFSLDNGGMIDVTIDGISCNTSVLDQPYVRVDYTVENVGTELVTVGESMFTLYADDTYVESTYITGDGDVHYGETLSTGRKLTGSCHFLVDYDAVNRIELEVFNDAIYVLKEAGVSAVSNSGSGEYTLLDPPPEDMTYMSDTDLYLEIKYFDGWADGSLNTENGVAYVTISESSGHEETYVMYFSDDGEIYLADDASESPMFYLVFYAIGEQLHVDVYNDSENLTFYIVG